jgi:MerR family Zn(II)-responsive transcriptional regulator of zntA
LSEVEARIQELQTMQRSLQRLNDACCGTPTAAFIVQFSKPLNKGPAKSDVDFFTAVYTRADLNHSGEL